MIRPVHKNIGTRLNFRHFGKFRRDIVGAGSGATDDLHVQPQTRQFFGRPHQQSGCLATLTAALLTIRQELQMPLITKYASETQPLLVHNLTRHLLQLFQATAAAAALPDIQIDQHIDNRAVLPRHRRQILYVFTVIDNHQHPRLAGKVDRPPQRDRIDDFVGDHHLGNPRVDHHLGFAHRCAAEANRSGPHLNMTDRRRFVCLGVRTQLRLDLGKIVGHRFHVAGHDFNIDHQRRGRQFCNRHSDKVGVVHLVLLDFQGSDFPPHALL